ncbi:hypothetical protein DQ04_04741010 [Trypanosoma grayi]|uniref:hypothetical protein n=1 Tax=Trypanosoma grayi TaxID=71804 RepID=UPI0004F41330|nr:hypothetical protein DQ04_04741010 [Trypanosoma grayi]KEG09730.1 hypothetical protein DQ04_04741010 [Trypanosoma grayi]
MRRLSVAHVWWVHAAVLTPGRSLKRKLSPDRTPDEEVQDRQNTFVWSDKHAFRPHQHFTYDPCSWSRPLEEKLKAKRRLTLVERLRALEERETEARRAFEAKDKAEDSEEPIANADYFYSLQDTAALPISLQNLLERMNELRLLLTMPRHAGIALAKVERLREEYREVLLSVYNRVRVGVVGETISFDALLYSWFLLLEAAEPLLEAVTAGHDRQEDVLYAIWMMRGALDTLLIHATNHMGASVDETVLLEGWVELLDVATHPFTRHGCTLRNDGAMPVCQLNALETLSGSVYARTMQATVDRMVGDAGVSAGAELLDPQHLHALLRCMKHCHCTDEAELQRAALVTRRVLDGILAVLKGAVAPSFRHSMRLALLGNGTHRVAADASGVEVSRAPIPVVLDMCDPPNGLKEPVTAADDALLVTQACVTLLRLTTHASSDTRAKTIETADILLQLLSYTPNYDLSIGETVGFVCELLEGGALGDNASSSERHLRVLLLLSRLQLSLCDDRALLCQLLCHMCRLTPPKASTTTELQEWKRLHGLSMHKLLQTLRAEEMCQHVEPTADGPDTWEALLAFGKYNGVVPLSLWRDACHLHFSGTSPLLPACARTLLMLRTRCRSNGAAVTDAGKVLSQCTTHMDFESVCLMARLLQIALGGRVTSEELTSDASAWDEARDAADGDVALLSLLDAAQRCIAARQATQSVVTTFL